VPHPPPLSLTYVEELLGRRANRPFSFRNTDAEARKKAASLLVSTWRTLSKAAIQRSSLFFSLFFPSDVRAQKLTKRCFVRPQARTFFSLFHREMQEGAHSCRLPPPFFLRPRMGCRESRRRLLDSSAHAYLFFFPSRRADATITQASAEQLRLFSLSFPRKVCRRTCGAGNLRATLQKRAATDPALPLLAQRLDVLEVAKSFPYPFPFSFPCTAASQQGRQSAGLVLALSLLLLFFFPLGSR